MDERTQALVPLQNNSAGDEAEAADCPCLLARALDANSREIVKLVVILISSILVIESGIMFVLPFLGVEHGLGEQIIDTLLLTSAMFPILYFSVVRRLAAKNEVLTRREQQLCQIRQELEERVVQRTVELKQSMQRLQAHQNEIFVLGEMTRLLQAARSLDEAGAIARLQLGEMLPGLAGSLYLLNASRNLLERQVSWGEPTSDVEMTDPAGCWALRRGKPHVVEKGTGIVCDHLRDCTARWHVCIPLMAGGDAVGVLCLETRAGTEDTDAAFAFDAPERLQFYGIVAESLSMALSNVKLYEKLQHQALRDPLTGLYNRRYMLEALERELLLAGRNNLPLSVIMLDIDHFKTFNDTFGHDAGDTVIAAVSDALCRSVRQSDFVCRYGGEEFLVVLPHAKADKAAGIAEKLRREVEGLPLHHQGQPLGRITISAGIAAFPEIDGDYQNLIEAADRALYQSKRNGRNCVSMASVAAENRAPAAVAISA